MTKAELIKEVYLKTPYKQQNCQEVFDALCLAISDKLKGNRTIEIKGFGTFKNRIGKPRLARNPRTKEQVLLGYRVIPTCKFHFTAATKE